MSRRQGWRQRKKARMFRIKSERMWATKKEKEPTHNRAEEQARMQIDRIMLIRGVR